MTESKKEWDKHVTPKKGTSKITQLALDWWHKLPIQNLEDMEDSWVGYLWKYYPEKDHPYHLTKKEILHIYAKEHKNKIRKYKLYKINKI